MKKLTLLTIAALTLTGLLPGSQPMTTHAATPQKQVFNNGNCVIISYGDQCNIQNVLDRLEDCFPGIIFPGCQLPGESKPEIEVPDCNVPEVEAPEQEAPQPDVPENNIPEIDVPEAEIPDMEIPETNKPEVNLPGNTPGNDSTDDNTSEENAPENSTPDNSQDSTGEHAYIKEVVRLVNAERAKAGLAPLTINTKVQAAAMVRAKECEQSFSHTRPNGTSFATALKEQGVSYRSAGENIAWGQKTPAEVVTAWMNSAGHRANIMNASFTTIGVGYYENARGTDYWCQLFTR